MTKQIKRLAALKGKTIADVEDSSINCITLSFTDGTRVMLEAENAGPPTGLLAISKYELDAENNNGT